MRKVDFRAESLVLRERLEFRAVISGHRLENLAEMFVAEVLPQLRQSDLHTGAVKFPVEKFFLLLYQKGRNLLLTKKEKAHNRSDCEPSFLFNFYALLRNGMILGCISPICSSSFRTFSISFCCCT